MISITMKDGIKTITLDREQKANSINKSLLKELHSSLKNINSADIRCLVITGQGDRVFCAGADLEEREKMKRDEIIDFLDEFRHTLNLIEKIDAPTIALMNGMAFGGGLELALACDIRLGKEGITLGLTETKLGIIPGAGGTQRLARLIGQSKAKDLIFRGAKIDSTEAMQYGILNKVYSAKSFLDESNKFINDILSSAPLAVKYAKWAIDKGLGNTLEDALEVERNEYLKTLSSVDRVEALNAFKEKRKPVFRGE